MRQYIILICLALAMAFVSGHYFLLMRGQIGANQEDVRDIHRIKYSLSFKNPPFFDLSYYFFNEEYKKLLNPSHYNIQDLRFTVSNKNSFCNNAARKVIPFINLEKQELFENYLCNKIKNLPHAFFRTPPLMHHSGKSFLYLYLESLTQNHKETKKKNLEQLYPYLHIKEIQYYFLQGLLDENVSSDIRRLARLKDESLSKIYNGKNFILEEQDIYISMTGKYPFERKTFFHIELDDFNRKIKDSPFVLGPFKEGKNCLWHEGNECWRYNFSHIFSVVGERTLILIGVSLSLILYILSLFFTKLKEEKLEDERRKLALRILTHEIRTPVAGLVMQLENMQDNFDALPEKLQDSFLLISDNVFRLQRLTEKSQSYLQIVDNKKLINVNKQPITSLNEFVENILRPYESKIEFIPLKNDIAVSMDSYWPGLCIKNIVDNAIIHGEPPIRVYMETNANEFKIIVEDQGYFLGKKDQKQNQNKKGLGLGLKIVEKVVKELGGKMYCLKNPTRFIMSFKQEIN